MSKSFLILDCYVDEPACLGVPPFISPYPRYIYGALACSGIDTEHISYETIDILRERGFLLDGHYDIVFLIGGAVVPGKYLGAAIGTVKEIEKIISFNRRQLFAAGGLVSALLGSSENLIVIKNDIEKFASGFIEGNPEDLCRTSGELARWSTSGAEVVKMSPYFPHVICEIETYRGCPREKHCSFCVEALTGSPDFRNHEDIIAEVDELIKHGVKRFRIGRQADILQYKSTLSDYRNGFPRPSPSHVAGLFHELKKRKDSGLITTLNIDNGNPGTIANFPEESMEILESIAGSITPGDTIAFGIESFDPAVIKQNNLKVDMEQALFAVKVVNETCGYRVNGIPVLLPGINLIHGLYGETDETFRINYDSLIKIRENRFLVKRINIRKLLPYPGTAAGEKVPVMNLRTANRFQYYRERIRKDIDHYMLKKIYPAGTRIEDVQVLDNYAGYSYGKQIASYSITARFPVDLQLRSFTNCIVTGHRERSLDVLPYPVEINSLPARALGLIPGISKKMASEIVLKRPFLDVDDFKIFLRDNSVNVNVEIMSAVKILNNTI